MEKTKFTLRLSKTENQQLENCKKLLNQATSSKTILQLISERNQLQITMDTDKDLINDLRESLSVAHAALLDINRGVRYAETLAQSMD